MTRHSCVGLFLVLILAAGACPAATSTWTGGAGNGSWTNPANWNGSVLPDFDDSDGIVSDILLSAVSNNTLMTVDGEKIINSLVLNTAFNYAITGETLTVKSGIITRSTASGTATQTIHNAFVFKTNAIITVNGNHSEGSWLRLNGTLSDEGRGFNLVGAGARNLETTGRIEMSGYVDNTDLYRLIIRGSNQLTSIRSSGGATFSLYGHSPSATNLILSAGTLMVRTNTLVPNARILFQGGGLSTAGGTGGSWARETIPYTNPITYKAGTLQGGGTESLVLYSDITLLPSSIFYCVNARNDVVFNFRGVLRDPESGPARLTLSASGATRITALSGTNTFTGRLTILTGTFTLNGELAAGDVHIGSPINTATVSGSGLFRFRNGDRIVVSNNATLTASALKFDMTNVTSQSQVLIDYRLGSLNGKSVMLTNALTPASKTLRWTLSDTGTLIVAERPSRGAVILIR